MRNEDLHPLQSAFIAHDAIQCGFCMPGLVMSCAELLVPNPDSSLDDVKMRRPSGPSLPYPLEITDRGRAGQLRDHPTLTN